MAKQQQSAERVASVAQQLAAGISESGRARDQLSEAVQEIASGAEKASSASQESLAAVRSISDQVSIQADATTQITNGERIEQGFAAIIEEPPTQLPGSFSLQITCQSRLPECLLIV